MKLITAVIRPTALRRLSTALRKARVSGMTVSRVEGFGLEHLSADLDLFGHLNPKVKVEVAVSTDDCDRVLALIESALAGDPKDSGGTVFVSSLDSMIKMPRE